MWCVMWCNIPCYLKLSSLLVMSPVGLHTHTNAKDVNSWRLFIMGTEYFPQLFILYCSFHSNAICLVSCALKRFKNHVSLMDHRGYKPVQLGYRNRKFWTDLKETGDLHFWSCTLFLARATSAILKPSVSSSLKFLVAVCNSEDWFVHPI